MILHRIKIAGYKTIGKTLEIQFPEEGRIGIWGNNESGKSTLLESIEYALYGQKPGASVGSKRGDVITWGKNAAQLEVEFSVASNRYRIQRRIRQKGSPQAQMVQVTDREVDRSSLISSIKAIQNKVEELTGMDRDTFGKLIYIKQKDLDALRDLQKGSREQFLNKVIGIEVFDKANRELKDRLKTVRQDLDLKIRELEILKGTKDEFDRGGERLNEFEKSILKLEREEEKLRAKLKHIQEKLKALEWLEQRDSLTDTVARLEKTLGNLNRYRLNKSFLADLSPKLMRLNEGSIVLQTISIERRNISKQREEIERQRKDLGLSDDDAKKLTNIQATKRQTLNRSLLFLGLGMGTTLIGLFNFFFIFVGFPLIGVGLYGMRKYLKLEGIASASTEALLISKQSSTVVAEDEKLDRRVDEAINQFGFDSIETISKEIDNIKETLRSKTGEGSMEGLKAVTQQLQQELVDLDLDDSNTTARVEESLEKARADFRTHENGRPSELETYDAGEYRSVSEELSVETTRYNELVGDLIEQRSKVDEIRNRLERIEEDYKRYPLIESQRKELENMERIVTRTLTELFETSKSIRTKVLPQAKYIINNILPTITNDRYADFEISDDLKFKVHSMDAGGYKEREIFSGGTQDQFLVALRLAFTQSILDSRVHADNYCLLMDECISSSDDSRKSGIFSVLETMKQTFSQIFIVAHEDVSNFVDHYLVLGRDDSGHTTIISKSW